MILHKAGKKIDESSVKNILEAANAKIDEVRIKNLLGALTGVNIEKAITMVDIPIQTVSIKQKVETKIIEKPKEDKKEEEKSMANAFDRLFGN